MARKAATALFAVLGIVAAGGLLFLSFHDRTTDPGPPPALPERADAAREAGTRTGSPLAEAPPQGVEALPDAPGEEAPARPRAYYTDDIEELKEQIYARRIDSIERLHLLDELVQTGDADTREFWGESWGGVDDWKANRNGFTLQKNDDGSLLFFPDEATARTYTFFENIEVYTYDEERREFVSEVDYYGKTIFNVIKFLRDDALAMMTISGRKVDLNVYERNADEP